MTKSSNGVWEVTLDLAAGDHTYKFVVDGKHVADPSNPNVDANGNSVVTIASEIVSPEVAGTKATFRYYAPDAKAVSVAGSWNATEDVMTKSSNGVWEVTLDLTAGDHTYKFVVDGKQVADPSNPDVDANGNSAVTIAPEIVSPEVAGTKATFRYYAPDAKAVSVAGSMNSWDKSASPMAITEDIWQLSLSLDPGAHQYKFVVDDVWLNDPLNTADTVDGNNVVVINGLAVTGNPDTLTVDTATALATTGKLFTAAHPTGLDTPVNYALAEPSTTVTLSEKDGVTYVTAAANHVGDVILTATATVDQVAYSQTINFKVGALNEYTINYYRHSDYDDWNLWIWPFGKEGAGVPFTSDETFTLSDGNDYTFKQLKYYSTDEKIGVIPRKGDWVSQDGGDRFIEIPAESDATQVWIVEGHTDAIYTDPSQINFEAKVKRAYADTATEITVTLSSRQWNTITQRGYGPLLQMET
ncbi:pullulanase-associated domain-containing protein [Candidatus Epulonipiscium viviparus]|uniref:pullulanase-associated domain-containing protein n=1 Tax=Candidatus Epulonipiscium viviparus TaxID=420336 RepID=UPI0027380A23|nr:pullulanase-associated domain-containing protein [Candidatus Epulopiscium viviparus]